jgi:hypothetical protein
MNHPLIHAKTCGQIGWWDECSGYFGTTIMIFSCFTIMPTTLFGI